MSGLVQLEPRSLISTGILIILFWNFTGGFCNFNCKKPNEMFIDRVGLLHPVRFIVVELTYLGLNLRFDMCVTFTVNYFFSGR
jgi:hypothetical protein